MAHRTLVAVEIDNGFKSIYVHKGSDLSSLLPTYHSTPELARLLVSYGDAYCIEKNTENNTDYHHGWDECMRQPDISVYYGRDKHEQGTGAMTHNSYVELMNFIYADLDSYDDYYLYCNGVWRILLQNTRKWEWLTA